MKKLVLTTREKIGGCRRNVFSVMHKVKKLFKPKKKTLK